MLSHIAARETEKDGPSTEGSQYKKRLRERSKNTISPEPQNTAREAGKETQKKEKVSLGARKNDSKPLTNIGETKSAIHSRIGVRGGEVGIEVACLEEGKTETGIAVLSCGLLSRRVEEKNLYGKGRKESMPMMSRRDRQKKRHSGRRKRKSSNSRSVQDFEPPHNLKKTKREERRDLAGKDQRFPPDLTERK